VLVAAATGIELALLEGVETFTCGIGPVEAALTTARVLASRETNALLHIGIAGARTLEPPVLVLGCEAVYCDVIDPASALLRVERAEPDAALLATARRVLPDVRVLPIATSGKIGGGASWEVEAMEGFGVLRAAALAGVPAVELRAVSNRVAEADRARWRIEEAVELLRAAVPRLVDAVDA
jgi:futalosine hydrolase